MRCLGPAVRRCGGQHSAEIAGLDPAQRCGKVVEINVAMRRTLLHGPEYCRRCWTKRVNCVCGVIPVLEYPHRILLSMHSKGRQGVPRRLRPTRDPHRACPTPELTVARAAPPEYGRMTNTGKIVVAALPNASLFIAQDAEDDRRFFDELERARGRCALLFPSASSISVRCRSTCARERRRRATPACPNPSEVGAEVRQGGVTSARFPNGSLESSRRKLTERSRTRTGLQRSRSTESCPQQRPNL